MPIPSQVPEKSGEGVETGWVAPKSFAAHGEGTVQTTNAKAAAKVEVVRILGSEVRILLWTPLFS